MGVAPPLLCGRLPLLRAFAYVYTSCPSLPDHLSLFMSLFRFATSLAAVAHDSRQHTMRLIAIVRLGDHAGKLLRFCLVGFRQLFRLLVHPHFAFLSHGADSGAGRLIHEVVVGHGFDI